MAPSMSAATLGEQIKIVFIVVFNVVFSVGVIFANKHLFQDLKFTHSATLTGIHFVATTLFSYALHALKIEKVNELDWRSIVILASATSASILFSNLSLLLNSVGFYQVTKLAIIPTTVVLQYFLYNMSVSANIKGALAILTLGVGIATVTQVDLQLGGFTVAIMGVFLTCFQQLIYSVLMKDKKVNGVQLYYNIGPLSAAMMLVIGLVFDYHMNDGHTILDISLPPPTLNWIMISSACAAPMNFSSAMMMEKTSAVTYQVVGHLKTIIIFLFGALFFSAIVTAQNATGFAIAMVGVFWYTHLQLTEKAAKQAASAQAPTSEQQQGSSASTTVQMEELQDEVIYEKPPSYDFTEKK